ncbi:PrpR N-terminal domain-containing protein, partial [Desulfovibrio sp. OttesenSCG-928-O18]|nr:PrpR N-terminal domain-containing protein [Desulfovibrio sp. OttesenSCG-928-O18]
MPTVPPIGMIATTVEIAQRTIEIAREMDMADMVSTQVGYLHDGLAIATRMAEEGAEVLISRRATTVLIEETLDIPNVTLPVTLEDLSLALSKARAATRVKSPRIGIFVMPSAQADVEAFTHHLGLDLRIYPVITDADYLYRMVDWAIADKMDVLIAGALVATYANERNLPCVLMDSGPIALRNALQEARRIVHGRKLEQMRAENFRIVVDTSYQGILVLDAAQNIAVANPAAHGILVNASIEVGTGFSSVLPELDLAPCFNGGEKIHNLFLSTASGPLVLDATPAMVDNAVRGVVVSFQPAESVTELGTST